MNAGRAYLDCLEDILDSAEKAERFVDWHVEFYRRSASNLR